MYYIFIQDSIAVLGKKSKRAITIFPQDKSGNVDLVVTVKDGSLSSTQNISGFVYASDAHVPLDYECTNEKLATLDYVYCIGGGIIGVLLLEVISVVVMKTYYK